MNITEKTYVPPVCVDKHVVEVKVKIEETSEIVVVLEQEGDNHMEAEIISLHPKQIGDIYRDLEAMGAPIALPSDEPVITVSAKALADVLQAFMGPSHRVMELYAVTSLPNSSVSVLVDQYNTWAEVQNKKNNPPPTEENKDG